VAGEVAHGEDDPGLGGLGELDRTVAGADLDPLAQSRGVVVEEPVLVAGRHGQRLRPEELHHGVVEHPIEGGQSEPGLAGRPDTGLLPPGQPVGGVPDEDRRRERELAGPDRDLRPHGEPAVVPRGVEDHLGRSGPEVDGRGGAAGLHQG
jgi:hypothetical protein